MRKVYIFLLCLGLAGCAAINSVPGSAGWHRNRLNEIEAAHKAGKLTEAEYIQAKNQADGAAAAFLAN